MKREKNGIYYSNKTKENEKFFVNNLKEKRYNPYRPSDYNNCAIDFSWCDNSYFDW